MGGVAVDGIAPRDGARSLDPNFMTAVLVHGSNGPQRQLRPAISAIVLAACMVDAAAAEPLANDSSRVVVSESGAAASTELGSPIGDPEYLIGPGDGLTISVLGAQDLSRTVRVRPDGYISFPLVEDVRAAGTTPGSLAAEIGQRLGVLIIDPEVTVTLSDSAGNSAQVVRIIGGAMQPKSIPYEAGMHVLDVIVAAGGLAPVADGNAAVLVRGDPAAPQRLSLRLDDLVEKHDLSANMAVAPGDIIVIPEGVFAGDWQRRWSLTLSPAFTDNARLAPSGDAEAAVVTALTPTLEVAGQGARVKGALSASVTGAYVALSDTGVEFIPDVVGAGNAELVRDTVYVDAAGAVNKVALDSSTSTSSVASIATNRSLVQSYQLRPYVVSRIEDLAYVETRYNLAGTVTGDTSNPSAGTIADSSSTLSDSLTNGLQVRVASPPERQSRIEWQALGYGQQTLRFEASDVTEGGGRFAPEIPLTRGFAILTSAGYSFIDVGDIRLSGPEGAAGFRYEPSPDLTVRATGGWRQENPQADVLVRYALGPRTTLFGSYTDSVEVGQTALIGTLDDLKYDPETRQFVNKYNDIHYVQQLYNTGYTLANDLTRNQQAVLRLVGDFPNDRLAIGAYYTKQENVDNNASSNTPSALGSEGSQTSWGVGLEWRRALDRLTAVETAVGVDLTDNGSGGANRTTGANTSGGDLTGVRFQVGLRRAVAENADAFATYFFQRRFADESDDEFTENAFVVGITHHF